MSVSVNIDSISAPDAVPGTAPNKVSNKAGKTTLQFKFTPKSTGLSRIRAWRVRIDPTNHNTGQLAGRLGMVCGSGDRCGMDRSRALDMASGTQVSEDVTVAERTGDIEGDHNVVVYAVTQEDGWSA
jgi:hypothetical protein